MKVSIVIPVYNGADYLADAIRSALEQERPAIEIIVINDGSTDNGETERVALSFGDPIRYIRQDNGGVASALNHGIREMKGDFFSWLSHDDLYHPAKLKWQCEAAETLPDNTIIYSDWEYMDSRMRPLNYRDVGNFASSGIRYHLLSDFILNGCAMLIPRSVLEACHGFDETMPTVQDYDLWFRFSSRYRFQHVPGRVLRSRVHAEQGSRVITSHKQECNQFLIHCLDAISDEELLVYSGLPDVAEALTRLILSWNRLHYTAAVQHALKRLNRHLNHPESIDVLRLRIRSSLLASQSALKGKEIILFGSGSQAVILHEELARLNLQPSRVLDNDQNRHGSSWKDLIIEDPKTAIPGLTDQQIIIPATSSADVIAEQLEGSRLVRNQNFLLIPES